jgi:hypothetical protein
MRILRICKRWGKEKRRVGRPFSRDSELRRREQGNRTVPQFGPHRHPCVESAKRMRPDLPSELTIQKQNRSPTGDRPRETAEIPIDSGKTKSRTHRMVGKATVDAKSERGNRCRAPDTHGLCTAYTQKKWFTIGTSGTSSRNNIRSGWG